jgi:hypothetical protein
MQCPRTDNLLQCNVLLHCDQQCIEEPIENSTVFEVGRHCRFSAQLVERHDENEAHTACPVMPGIE